MQISSRPFVLVVALAAAPAATASGCGSNSSAGTGSTTGFPSSSSGATSSSSASTSSGTGTGGMISISVDAGQDAANLPAQVFVNSTTQLFVFDVTTNTLALVGPLAGCSSGVQDIAVDDNGNMIATDGTTMWNVDSTTGKCLGVAVPAAPGVALPVAITFVPKETFGTPAQALVGYTHTDYVRVDLSSAQVTKLGQLGDGYKLSGDFVAVNGGPTYVSVTGGPSSGTCADCLVEIDVTTGAITKLLGSTGYREYGLAFWGGVVYGFNSNGQVVQTTFPGAAAVTTLLSVNPQHYAFVGAGSTTAAPLIK